MVKTTEEPQGVGHLGVVGLGVADVQGLLGLDQSEALLVEQMDAHGLRSGVD